MILWVWSFSIHLGRMFPLAIGVGSGDFVVGLWGKQLMLILGLGLELVRGGNILFGV